MSAQAVQDNLSDLKQKGYLDSDTAPGMRGFEPQYKHIVDYIVRITHRIWEEGDMGYIYDTYLHNVTVHTGYGTSYGVEDVVSGSIAFLAAMPDRRMYAEDVIWSGDDEQGYHSSHLIINTGTNTGYSPWGPPTGRKANFLAIANCFVKENRVVEEWLVRDTAGLVRQLGYSPHAIARSLVSQTPGFISGETDRLQGQLPPSNYISQEGDAPIEVFIRELFHELWNGRHFNYLNSHYAEGAVLFAPNHVQIQGVANIRAYHLGLISMFPDAYMSVEHVYWLGNDEDGYRVAVRWRMTGTHGFNGWYGAPTGRRVNILGVSHVHVKNNKVHKHYMVFDELALLAQLAASGGEDGH